MRPSKLGRHAALSAIYLALPLAACSAQKPKDVIEAVPFKSTVMLASTDLASLAPDNGDGVLAFTTAPDALAQVKRGSILVATVSPSTPTGLLRVVKSVTRSGTSLTLETLNAPVQLAFARLHMDIQPRSSGPLGALKPPQFALTRSALT